MPALSGQVIMQLTDGTGAPAITVTWFFDPTTRALRNNPTSWTAPDGTVYPAGAGALIADNQLGRTVGVRVNDSGGNLVRQVRISAGGSRAVKAAVLAAAPPPDGPYTTADDFNGLTFDLS